MADRVGSAGSEAWRLGAGWPGDAAGVEEDAEPVVLEGLEAVTAALHLLHAQVQPFGRSVGRAGVVVGEDLGPPRSQGLAQRADLGHVVGQAADDGLVQQQRGVGRGVGQVHVAHRFFGQPGAEELVVRVTDAQAEQHPSRALLVEAFGAGEQQLADPKQRIAFAASMAEGLVLDPAADLVDAAVPDPHHMKRVGHPAGVSQTR